MVHQFRGAISCRLQSAGQIVEHTDYTTTASETGMPALLTPSTKKMLKKPGLKRSFLPPGSLHHSCSCTAPAIINSYTEMASRVAEN